MACFEGATEVTELNDIFIASTLRGKSRGSCYNIDRSSVLATRPTDPRCKNQARGVRK